MLTGLPAEAQSPMSTALLPAVVCNSSRNPGRVILVSHRWPRQRPERNPPLTAEYVKFLAAGDRGSAVARDRYVRFGLMAYLHRDIRRGFCAPLPPGYQPKETTDESDRNA